MFFLSVLFNIAAITHGLYTLFLTQHEHKLLRVKEGTSLAVQWLGLHTSTVGGTGLIPGRGTKTPPATQCRPPHQKKEEKK